MCCPLGRCRTFSIILVPSPLNATNTFSQVEIDKVSSIIATWPLDGKNCPQLRKTIKVHLMRQPYILFFLFFKRGNCGLGDSRGY